MLFYVSPMHMFKYLPSVESLYTFAIFDNAPHITGCKCMDWLQTDQTSSYSLLSAPGRFVSCLALLWTTMYVGDWMFTTLFLNITSLVPMFYELEQ